MDPYPPPSGKTPRVNHLFGGIFASLLGAVVILGSLNTENGVSGGGLLAGLGLIAIGVWNLRASMKT